MIVTTAGRTDKTMMEKAKQIASELQATFVTRNKSSVEEMKRLKKDDVMVVGKDRLVLHPIESNEPVFFHPNSAMFRIKRLLKGEGDPFVTTSDLKESMTLLDCTLGLGSDAIIASFITGAKGKVVGVEATEPLAYLVQEGLSSWDPGLAEMKSAMERVEVIQGYHLDYLQRCPNNSFDVVYFDPMFDESILESDGIKGIKAIAEYSVLSLEAITEAKRVARRRVVLKDHWKSPLFNRFGFHQVKRKTALFHYGYIDLS